MDLYVIMTIGGICCLLLLSAFFSGSETSLTGASRPRMHNLEQHGNERARAVNALWARKERVIGAILLGNNLVNILASALATSIFIRFFGDAGVAYATFVMTLLVLIFAELLPKTYAIHHADRSALVVAPPLRVAVVILVPFSIAIQAIVRGILRLFGAETEGALTAETREEELRGAIELHHGPSEEVRAERAMLRSVLDLADVEVGEVMTYRRNVVAIDADLPVSQIVKEVLAAPYTRLPLYRDSQDNIVGVMHAKALFRAVQAHPDKVDELDIVAIASEPWFVPDTTDLLTQLEAFQRRHEHFAVVVDEYGEVLGVVTLEDILEEIVGEIADELDIEADGVRPLKDGAIEVEGWVTIRDLNRMFEWRLPDAEANTVAGLLLQEARRIPDVGQSFLFHELRFEVLARKRNQVTKIKISPIVLEDAGEESDGDEPGPA